MMEPHKEIVNGYEFWMQPVEEGTFDMGDEQGDLPDGCRPVHKVKVSDFYIGKHLFTQALWKAVLNVENPSRFQDEDRPVEQVSWDDITQKFLPALHKLTRLEYRLPLEAEWEYAARGGKFYTEGHKYAGSDRLKDVGWFDENSGDETKPVGIKYPNQLGIFDMSGNVWEWCEDGFGGSEFYQECKKKDIVENPRGREKGPNRVIRGGCWLDDVHSCRVAYRFIGAPSNRARNIGFRLALSL